MSTRRFFVLFAAWAGAALIAACASQNAAPSATPGGSGVSPAGAAAADCPATTPVAPQAGPPMAGGGAPGGPDGPGALPGPGGSGVQGFPGGPGGRQAGPTATPEPLPTLVPVPAGVLRFEVVPNRSTATFRVREQLVGVQFPNDAVGCTGAVSGQLVVRPSGEFVTESSRIVVDLRELKTDNQQRDSFIKMNTIQTGRYPLASFSPVSTQGLPSPLPAAGSHTFTLTGQMTVRGITREQTWHVTARREGNQLSGTATTSFQFGDYGMAPPRVPVVLSVVDEIRLEVRLEAVLAA